MSERIVIRRTCAECGGTGRVNWRGIAGERQVCDDCFGRGSVEKELTSDHRIIGPEDIAAIRTLTEFVPTMSRLGLLPTHVNQSVDRLAALIGDGE